jgi:hypothetical protein
MDLSKEQILGEPTGKQMDIWVAEYVMGYDLTGKKPDLPIRFVGTPPNYSEDISFAWEVVLALSKPIDGEYFQVTVCEKPYIQGAFCARWSRGHLQQVAFADSAPLAICRAALLAKLAEE